MSFKTTDSAAKETSPYPIKTIEVNNAEMQTFKTTFLGNTDKTPYIICNVQDPNAKKYFLWNGSDWIDLTIQGGGNSENIIAVDFSLDGIYSNGGTFASIPIQVLIAKILDVGTYTKVEAKICVSYNTSGVGVTGEYRLFNYSDFVAMAGTLFAVPAGTWVYASSNYFDITPEAGKAIRLESRKIGGGGGATIQTEAAKLLLKFS
jgi:hypothetical protein